jgi:transposase, IS30 family
VSYQQLSLDERQQIYVLIYEDCLSIRAIARLLQRAASTISRELYRNTYHSRYLPDTAQQIKVARRQASKQPFVKVTSEMLESIKKALRKRHSPEQIAGRLKLEGQVYVSHETIYQMIYADYQGMEICRDYLRQSQRVRRRRSRSKSKRGIIPNRVGIEFRAAEVDKKERKGDWEGDTVIGANHQGGLVTYVDKASKFLMVGLIKNRKAEHVNTVSIQLFQDFAVRQVETVTFDNGKEFSRHEVFGKAVGAACYFARPYHSWERGLNEHTNGLIRQFFPKQTNFRIVKSEQVQRVMDLINDRPRKSLGYQTPREVFYGQSGTCCTSNLNRPLVINIFGVAITQSHHSTFSSY